MGWSETIKVIGGLRDTCDNSRWGKISYFYLSTSENNYMNGNFMSGGGSSDTAKWMKVDAELKNSELISNEQYNTEVSLYNKQIENQPEVIGIPYKKIQFKIDKNDLLVDGFRFLNVRPKEEGDVQYNIYGVYRVQIDKHQVNYFVKIENNMPHINAYNTNKLITVIDGKVLKAADVYENLEFIAKDTWRSNFNVSGTRHTYIHKLGHMNISDCDYVLNNLVKSKVIKSKDNYELIYVGNDNQKILFSLTELVNGVVVNPNIRFITLDRSNKVIIRKEKFRATYPDDKFWFLNNQIYALAQDNQIIKNLTKGNHIFINGSNKLGKFTLDKQTFSKNKLPLYKYNGEHYICIEDLPVLGYELKWDAKERIGNWQYTGTRRGTFHKFTDTEIYDNDVFARVDGTLFHIYNAEGYSIIKLNELKTLERMQAILK